MDTTTTGQYSAEFKAQVAIEAIKAKRSISEIATAYEVSPEEVLQWKEQALEGMGSLFASKKDQATADHEALTAQLQRQIGKLSVEVNWLKKKHEDLGLPVDAD